jgi:hypothetical protein
MNSFDPAQTWAFQKFLDKKLRNPNLSYGIKTNYIELKLTYSNKLTSIKSKKHPTIQFLLIPGFNVVKCR